MALIPLTYKDGSQLDVIGGSIIGTLHQKDFRNNQDAYGWGCIQDPPTFVGIVADGCTNENTGAHEVGANAAVELIKNSILRQIKESGYPSKNSDIWSFWNDIAVHFTDIYGGNFLANMVNPGPTREDTLRVFDRLIRSYGLFTINEILITDTVTHYFIIGDGVIGANGNTKILGEEFKNKPPYIMYSLVPDLVKFKKEELGFEIWVLEEKESLKNFMIGTDGVSYLIRKANENVPDPSSNEKVGDINQFWQDDIYFKAKNALNAKLSRINTEAKVARLDKVNKEPIARLEIHPGLLPDDTTFIVGRRFKR